MNLSREEFKKLILPILAAIALLGAGGGLIWSAGEARRNAERQLASAQGERQQNAEKLARIAEEEREVKEKIQVYQQLKQLGILGEEKRLEWADSITRIRAQLELLDLKYRVEKQQQLSSVAGKPANVDFFASTMKVNLALLHEEDMLRFLSDLRSSGNAFYSVKRCALSRVGGQASATVTTIAPRLRADCEIDLVTIIDRAAKL